MRQDVGLEGVLNLVAAVVPGVVWPGKPVHRMQHGSVAFLEGFSGHAGPGPRRCVQHGNSPEARPQDHGVTNPWVPHRGDQQLDVHMCWVESSQVACWMHL